MATARVIRPDYSHVNHTNVVDARVVEAGVLFIELETSSVLYAPGNWAEASFTE